MRWFDSSAADFDALFRAFLNERRGAPADVDAAVADILETVRTGGIAAVLDYARRFDKADLTADTLRVTAAEIDAGAAACDPSVRDAIAFAAKRIETYHASARPTSHGPMRPASNSAGAGRPSKRSASTCPAAARLIPPPC